MVQAERVEEAIETEKDPIEACRQELQESLAAAQKTRQDHTTAERIFRAQREDTMYLVANLAISAALPLAGAEGRVLVGGALVAGALAETVRTAVRRDRLRNNIIETPHKTNIEIYYATLPFSQVKPGETVLDVAPGLPLSNQPHESLIHSGTHQLTELLAITKDAKYDHIMLPSYLLALPQAHSEARREVLSRITGCSVGSPDEALVNVLTKAEFEAVGKYIEQISEGSVLRAVLAKLTEGAQSRYVSLFLQNQTGLEAVRPYMERYLRQVLLVGLDDQLDQAYRDRPGTDTDSYVTKHHLTNRLSDVNGMLAVHQYNEKQQVVHTHSVASTAAIPEIIGSTSFWHKLRQGAYSRSQLAYLAINILHTPLPQEETVAESEAAATLQFEPNKTHSTLELTSRELRRKEFRQRLQRSIGAGLLLLVAVGGLKFVADSWPASSSKSKPAMLSQPLTERDLGGIGQAPRTFETDWHIDSHGLEPTGYYQERLFDTFTGKDGWRSSKEVKYVKDLPFMSFEGEIPRLTLERFTNAQELGVGIWLPVHENTRLANVRLSTLSGTQVAYTSIYSDGAGYMVKAAGNIGDGPDYLRLEADFTYSKLVDPFYQADGEAAEAARREQTETVAVLAEQTKDTYLYDNTKALDTISRQATDAPSLLKALDKAGICNCNLCASRAILLAQQQGIAANFAAGYLNTGNGPDATPNELRTDELHAWVNSNNTLLDPTPSRMTAAEIKARSDGEPDKPEAPPPQPWLAMGLPLGALLGLEAGRVGYERVRKAMSQRSLGSARTREAFEFLNWVAYGAPDSRLELKNYSPKLPEQLKSSITSEIAPETLRDYLSNQPWKYENAASLNYRQVFAARHLARKALAGKL